MSQWPAAHDDLLRQSWARGLTCELIGDLIGRSRNSIIGRAHRLKLEARPRKPPIPKAKPMKPKSKAVKLMDLENHHCRFPVDSDPIMYCGGSADMAAGRSYCDFHHAIAYHKPERARQPYVPGSALA